MTHKVREALDLLHRDGWNLEYQTGSHRQFTHPTKRGRVTVAGKESTNLAPKTWTSSDRQG